MKNASDPSPSNSPGVLSLPPGVDPAYLDLFEEATRRGGADFLLHENGRQGRRHGRKGPRGIVIGPVEGNFERHGLRALRNGRRIRNVLLRDDETARAANNNESPPYRGIKLAIMTSKEHASILRGCPGGDGNAATTEPGYMAEACRLWNNGTLFDDVIVLDDEPDYKWNDEYADLSQGSSKFWLKALGGYRHAPYVDNLFLDSDSYPCPGVGKLFALLDPEAPGKNWHRYWQLPVVSAGDVAVGVEQFSGWYNPRWVPGDPELLKDSLLYAIRNTGTVLFSFRRQVSHVLAHFIPLVAEHVYNNVATADNLVINDQVPFRMALYLFRKFVPSPVDFVEHQIPMHASCRTYPGSVHAGTDGFLNGMYPLQQDGTRCHECSCTPCLVNHNAGSWRVWLNGETEQMGWEEDFRFENENEGIDKE